MNERAKSSSALLDPNYRTTNILADMASLIEQPPRPYLALIKKLRANPNLAIDLDFLAELSRSLPDSVGEPSNGREPFQVEFCRCYGNEVLDLAVQQVSLFRG